MNFFPDRPGCGGWLGRRVYIAMSKHDITCPICRQRLARDWAEKPWAPFCSKRCQMVDLGQWFDESYIVDRPLEDDDLPEAPPAPAE